VRNLQIEKRNLQETVKLVQMENSGNVEAINNLVKEVNLLKEQKARLQRMLSTEQKVRQSSFVNLANTIDHNERSTAKKKSVSKTKLIHNKVPLAAKEPKE
jgi:hypothetical protein